MTGVDTNQLMRPNVVTPDEWLAARNELLAREKAFTRARDELSAARRALPWLKLERDYTFDGAHGRQTLAELFAGRSQLLVYHFMFPDAWEAGCKSCSLWADGYDGVVVHLAARDVSLVAVSRAPYAKLAAFQRRMGWSFPWVSSAGNSFNRDFDVSFTAEEIAARTPRYNFGSLPFGVEEAPGITVFARDEADNVYRTYSCYARGLDMLNPAYHLLDLTPRGRDEDGLGFPMAWVRLHDSYGE